MTWASINQIVAESNQLADFARWHDGKFGEFDQAEVIMHCANLPAEQRGVSVDLSACGLLLAQRVDAVRPEVDPSHGRHQAALIALFFLSAACTKAPRVFTVFNGRVRRKVVEYVIHDLLH